MEVAVGMNGRAGEAADGDRRNVHPAVAAHRDRGAGRCLAPTWCVAVVGTAVAVVVAGGVAVSAFGSSVARNPWHPLLARTRRADG